MVAFLYWRDGFKIVVEILKDFLRILVFDGAY